MAYNLHQISLIHKTVSKPEYGGNWDASSGLATLGNSMCIPAHFDALGMSLGALARFLI